MKNFPSAYCPGALAVDDYIDAEGDLKFHATRVDPAHETRVYLRRPEVAALRDHLTAVLGEAPVDPCHVETLVEGREYRLLPHATTTTGGATCFGPTTTRVVMRDTHPGGDAVVQAQDGPSPGLVQYVDPRFLATLDAPVEDPLAELSALAAAPVDPLAVVERAFLAAKERAYLEGASLATLRGFDAAVAVVREGTP